MKRIAGMIGLWALATLVTGAVALTVVRAGGEAVSEDAFRPVTAAQLEAFRTAAPASTAAPAVSTTIVATSTTATTAVPTATTETPQAQGVTTLPPDPGTTIPDPPAPATTVPSPDPTEAPSSDSTTSANDTTEAFTITAGTVVVTWGDWGVRLVSASPAPGYRVEVKNGGPPQVQIEFESEGTEAFFQAEVSDGQLQVSSGVENED